MSARIEVNRNEEAARVSSSARPAARDSNYQRRRFDYKIAPAAHLQPHGQRKASHRPKFPRADKVLMPNFDFSTHRGIVALTPTLRAVPIASRSVQPALVGLCVAHAAFAIRSPMPSHAKACPSSSRPGSVSGSRCLPLRSAGLPAASTIPSPVSEGLLSAASRAAPPPRILSASCTLPPNDPPAEIRGGRPLALRGSPAARRIVLAMDTVWTAGPVGCSRPISQPPRPRANLVLRHPRQGRPTSSVQPDRLPDASISIKRYLQTDALWTMRSPASSRKYSRLGMRDSARAVDFANGLRGVAIGVQQQPTTPAACEGSLSSSTGPIRARRRLRAFPVYPVPRSY
ncbi:hypothetical protein AURDEDRAFT_174703 [Auricularia subglabra TFB-10046 SS5]|nr:hypothetical protein AURDEDRAFT_174703 [Auricularia subglabra TFB-10046 SS5]